jgi:DNA primase catalytic core
MSNVKEILDFHIYPAIYQKIDQVLPEFGFKRIANGFLSTTGIKIDGGEGKPGKVYIYDNNISSLVDYTRGSCSLWSYFQQKNSFSNFETLKHLADLAGVSLANDYKPEDIEKIKEITRSAEIWEEANSFFIDCLSNQDNEFYSGAEANKIRKYIAERGYTDSDIKIPEQEANEINQRMELGYIPSQEILFKHLEGKGFTREEISQKIQLNPGIGSEHKLTIPYRDNLGRIRGIIARNINHSSSSQTPKYLYSTGLKRDDILFNLKILKGDKDLVVVEGILDCLIAEARGVKNIVALGGTSLNYKQLDLAKKYGAKKVTLCLDNDEAGKKATLKAIEVIKHSGLKLYVSSLPDGIKDPDQLIKEQGIESFNETLENSQSYYMYLLDAILEPYSGKINFSDKDRDDIISASYDLFDGLTDPIEKELFYSVMQSVTNGAVTEAGFKAKSDEIRAERRKQRQEQQLSRALNQAEELLKDRKLKSALEVVTETGNEIKIETAQDLIDRYTYGDFLHEMRNTPMTLKTGIPTLDEFGRIPHGAITLVAGRPSHGKTTFMFNLLLNMSDLYPDKKFYFFSYEEQKKFILVKILNRLINKDIVLFEYPGLNTNLERLKAYLANNREDIAFIEEGKKKLKDLLESGRIEIIDRAYIVEDLAMVVNHLYSRESVGAFFIDYVQRIRTGSKTQDKRVEIGYISDYILNNIAKKTGLPVILGAQFNRGAGESPKLEHLKEAGNLEEDANLVLSVYQQAREDDTSTGKRDVELEIKAIKNRDGAVNTKTILKFDRFTGNIRDYSNGFK